MVIKQRNFVVCILAAVLLAGFITPFLSAQEKPEVKPVVDPDLMKSLEYRMIGPSRGGRSAAVAGIQGDPYTFYMGASGGGVWKTTDAGTTWINISDGFFDCSSIGAIAVSSCSSRFK